MEEENMILHDARCTNCGASLSLGSDEVTAKCQYCQSQLVIEQAIAFSKVEVDRSKEIVKLRQGLEQAIQLDSHKEIVRISSEILNVIPDDFESNYFFSYGKSKLNEPSFIRSFLTKKPIYTSDSLQKVVLHLIEYGSLQEHQRIKSFIEIHHPQSLDQYQIAYKKKVKLEDQYANVPRDVFICFSSYQELEASKISHSLEKDGYSTWISINNLRPNDNDNYWRNIEDAIKLCSTFLVVSTEAAMLSKDVQREVQIAQKLKKPLIEVKLDNAPHTTLFKHVFDGLKWIDATQGLESKIPLILSRVLETKKPNKPGLSTLTPLKTKKGFNKLLLISSLAILIIAVVVGFNLFSSPNNGSVIDNNSDTTTPPEVDSNDDSNLINPPLNENDNTLNPSFEVSFIGLNNQVISVITVAEGESATPPLPPVIEGFIFNRWQNSLNNIRENTVIRAIYHSVPQFIVDGSLTYPVNTTPNFLLGIQATDFYDGNLTQNIIIFNLPPANQMGEFTVSYRVTNSSGISEEITRNVIVTGVPPVLSGILDINIPLDAAFDLRAGISAFDAVDGDITDAIEISGNIDVGSIGIQTITYKVTNSLGLTTEMTREINVTNQILVINSENNRYQFIIDNESSLSLGGFNDRVTSVLDLPIPQKNGYIFKGWSYQGDLVHPNNLFTSFPVSLEAQWVENHFGYFYLTRVPFDLNSLSTDDMVLNKNYSDFRIRTYGYTLRLTDAIIFEYSGLGSHIEIPEMIHNRIVNHVWLGCMNGCFTETPGALPGSIDNNPFYSLIRTLHLPKLFSGTIDLSHLGLTAITVAEENQTHNAVDGVLYRNNMTQLVSYPKAKTDIVFRLPDEVQIVLRHALLGTMSLRTFEVSENSNLRTIENSSFLFNRQLIRVELPKTFETYDNAFSANVFLREIIVHPDNPRFESIDGFFIDKTNKKLLRAPNSSQTGVMDIPDEIRLIGENALSNLSNVRQINFSEESQLIEIEGFAFMWNSLLESITFPSSLQSVNIGNFMGHTSLKSITFNRSAIVDGSITEFRIGNSQNNPVGFALLQGSSGNDPLRSDFRIRVPLDSLNAYKNGFMFDRIPNNIIAID